MLSYNEVTQVYKCMIYDHALLRLNYTDINAQSQALIDKVKSGIELTKFELNQSPEANCYHEVKIVNSETLTRLYGISISAGQRFNSDVTSQEYSYLSLLINPADIRFQHFMLIHVKTRFPEFWKVWTEQDVDEAVIFFPFKYFSDKGE